jgi:hypothetical protein
MDKFKELEKLIADLKEDVTKFYEKGNKAAGTRIRKGMQDAKKLCQELRVNIQETKKTEE